MLLLANATDFHLNMSNIYFGTSADTVGVGVGGGRRARGGNWN